MDNEYYSGTVIQVGNGGFHHVFYNDGDTEQLNLRNEGLRFLVTLAGYPANTKLKLKSTEQDVLNSILDFFGNKPLPETSSKRFRTIFVGLHLQERRGIVHENREIVAHFKCSL